MICVPDVDRDPFHPPAAVHAVAFCELQFKEADVPLVTVLGLALNCTVGAGGMTVTVTDCEVLPPTPLQLRVKTVLAVSAVVVRVPLRP